MLKIEKNVLLFILCMLIARLYTYKYYLYGLQINVLIIVISQDGNNECEFLKELQILIIIFVIHKIKIGALAFNVTKGTILGKIFMY